jgi:hypothetical protein
MVVPTAHLRWQTCQKELIYLKSIYEATFPILSVTPPSWIRPDGNLFVHASHINHVWESLDILIEHEEMTQPMQELASLISDQKFPISRSTSSSGHLAQIRAELKSINTLLTESSCHSSIDFIRKDEEAEILKRHLRTETAMVKRSIAEVSFLGSDWSKLVI